MAATGSTPARPGTTVVGQGGADHGSSPPNPPSWAAAPPPRPSPGPSADDWAAQTADSIERLVGSVRAKTTTPLERVAKILVYGLLAGIVAVAAVVLGAVGVVRGLDLVIPGGVWSAHALSGGIFCLAGLFLWRKRSVKTVKV